MSTLVVAAIRFVVTNVRRWECRRTSFDSSRLDSSEKVNAAGPLLCIHQCGTYLLQCQTSLSWLLLSSVLGIQLRIPVVLPRSGRRFGSVFIHASRIIQLKSLLAFDDPQGPLRIGAPLLRRSDGFTSGDLIVHDDLLDVSLSLI